MSSESDMSLWAAVVGLILAVVLVLAGKPSDEDVRATLASSGYSSIELRGRAWFACGEDDRGGQRFYAKNPTGQLVAGTVCCGWWKGCTVRF